MGKHYEGYRMGILWEYSGVYYGNITRDGIEISFIVRLW